MTDALFALVAQYGPVVIFFSVIFSCLAVPVPSSVLLLGAGGFAASGDLILWQVALAAFTGTFIGDQMAYFIGRSSNQALLRRLKSSPGRKKLVSKAEYHVARWGGLAVFLSRNIFSPLAAYVNYISGIAGLA